MNIIFKTIYKLWNRASWSKINSVNDLSEKGYLKLKLNKNSKTKLDFELEKIYNKALDTVKFYKGNSVHDLSKVGNLPLNLKSLADKNQIKVLNDITNSIINENPQITDYLGLKLNQLSFDLTLLCNTTSDIKTKVGSQNYHRDIYHSFYRGIKVFYGYNYNENIEDGAFSFIPLDAISSNVRPSTSKKFKYEMKQSRFDHHPLISKHKNKALVLKKRELTAIDTYNSFHSGGFIKTPNFVRLIFQIVVLPPQNPEKFNNIAEDHFQRTLYFYMIKFRNIFRKSVTK